MTDQDRLIDADTEAAFLAALVTDPRRIDTLATSPEAFGVPRNAQVYDAILLAHESGDGVNAATIGAHLAHAKRRVTQRDVHELLSLSAPWLDAAALHRRLTDLHRLRKRRAELDLARAAVEREDVAACVEHASAAAADMDGRTLEESNAHTAAHDAFRRLIAERPVNLPTLGLADIDAVTGGHGGGELIIVAADTNVGKSSFALMTADILARRAMRLGYISCEDPVRVVGDRILAKHAGISIRAMRERRLSRDDLNEAANAVERLRESVQWPIAYLPGATDSDVVQAMSRMVRKQRADMLCVDYAQAIECSRTAENRRMELRSIAARIKSTAARLGVPVMLMSQITVERKTATAQPGKHDLRDSRDLAHMAELVVVLWRDADEDRAPVHWRVVKSKTGGNGAGGTLRRGVGGALEADGQAAYAVGGYEAEAAQ